MKPIAEVVAEYLERAFDPRFGAGVNDDYTARLGYLLKDQEAMQKIMQDLLRDEESVKALAPSVWWCILNKSSADDFVISKEVLHALYERQEGIAIKSLVVRRATGSQSAVNQASNPFENENRWLRERLDRVFLNTASKSDADSVREFTDVELELRLWTLTIASLQAGTQASLSFASSLIGFEGWEKPSLREGGIRKRFDYMLATMPDVARDAWRRWNIGDFGGT